VAFVRKNRGVNILEERWWLYR